MPPTHKPTPDSKKRAFELARRGVPQDIIAIAVGLSDKSRETLRVHYKNELDQGALECRSGLLEMAHERAKNSDAILIFLLKTQCGLSEHGPRGDDAKPSKIISFRVTGRGERLELATEDDDNDRVTEADYDA